MIDGGFHAQDAALFVIELERIAVDKMFDAQTFLAVLEAAVEFPGKFAYAVGRRLVAQEAEHIPAPKALDPVMHQSGIKLRQPLLAGKHHIGRILALKAPQ